MYVQCFASRLAQFSLYLAVKHCCDWVAWYIVCTSKLLIATQLQGRETQLCQPTYKALYRSDLFTEFLKPHWLYRSYQCWGWPQASPNRTYLQPQIVFPVSCLVQEWPVTSSLSFSNHTGSTDHIYVEVGLRQVPIHTYVGSRTSDNISSQLSTTT